MTKVISFIILCAALGGCAVHRHSAVISHGLIMSSEKPMYVSGVVSTYAMAEIVVKDGKTRTIFFQYFDVDQFIPVEGDKCDVHYQEARISGRLRSISLHLERAPLVKTIRCDSGSWSEALSDSAARR